MPHNSEMQIRRRALLRLSLGMAQVIGSTATLVLLMQQGVTPLVITAALMTSAASVTSLVLFRVIWRSR